MKSLKRLGAGSALACLALCGLAAPTLAKTLAVHHGQSIQKAKNAGLRVMTVPEASAWGDVVMILIPDQKQKEVYNADIKEHLSITPESAGLLAISRGFPLVAKDDLETLARASFLYDALYASLAARRGAS